MTETSTQHYFGAWNCRGGRPGVARFFTAPCFQLSLRRGQTKNHCPKLQRGLISVHGFVAAVARALPGFSPRLAFGCRPGTDRQKFIARNFNATLARCIDLSRQSPGHCPVFHRDLLSVVSHARPDRKLLPETSPRLAFGCRSGAAGQKIVARFFTAPCSRLSLRRGGTKIHCPIFHRDLLSVVAPTRPDKNSLPETSARP